MFSTQLLQAVKTKVAPAILLALSITTAASLTTQASADASSLKQQLASIVQASQTDEKICSAVYVKLLSNGRVLYSKNGNKPMIPASNLKVATTAAALDKFGPNYRFTTEVRAAKPDANGVVKSNLYLRGNGDPTITPPYCQPASIVFAKFVDKLKAAGVKTIDGDIVADDSAFDRQFFPQGWLEHYRYDSYSAPVSALSFNGNLVEVIVGSNGCVAFNPPSCTLRAVTNFTSGPLDISTGRSAGVVNIGGGIPGDTQRCQITVDNPPFFAVGCLANLLHRRGINCTGKIRLIKEVGEPAEVNRLHLYAAHKSERMADIIYELNHESDNLFAEHLFRALGVSKSGKGTAKSGMAACSDFMRQHDINTAGLKMVDGCGLSRLNRIAPSQLVGVLEAMQRSPYKKIYKDSLPPSGRGTLRGRLGGIKVRAKTGTLANDTSLTGYVVTAAGQEVVFSIMYNNVYGVWTGVDAQNKIVETLAAWPEKL